MTRMRFAVLFAFIALGAAFYLGLQYTGADKSAPMVTTILGFITVVVTQLMGNKTAEDTKADLRNGRVEKLVRAAIEKVARDADSSLDIRKETETHASGTGGGDIGKEDNHNG